MRLLKLNKEGDDSRFIYALDLSDLCVLYACFIVQHCTSWVERGGGRRTCGHAEKKEAGKERSGEVGGHRSRSRPFPMEQAIGWS